VPLGRWHGERFNNRRQQSRNNNRGTTIGDRRDVSGSLLQMARLAVSLRLMLRTWRDVVMRGNLSLLADWMRASAPSTE
jgi:hypothetical protein